MSQPYGSKEELEDLPRRNHRIDETAAEEEIAEVDFARHNVAFEKHPVTGKKRRVRRMKPEDKR